MTLHDIVRACEYRQAVVIALTTPDWKEIHEQIRRLNAEVPEWRYEDTGMRYRGVPIVPAPYSRFSYFVEDTPELPTIHVIG